MSAGWDSPEPLRGLDDGLDDDMDGGAGVARSPRLVVVAHSRTGSTARMTGAVLAGTRSEGIDGVEVITMDPLAPDPLAVFRAGAVILGTPTNFGYMSGALKHFFDEIYRPLLDRTRGKPFSFYVKGATDTDGCVHAIGTITTGLGWREAAPPVVVTGDLTETHLAACFELGAQMAASLAEGLW